MSIQPFVPAIHAIREFAFILTFVALYALIHASIDTFIDGNSLITTGAGFSSIFSLQMSMSVLIISAPTWLIFLYLTQSHPIFNKLQQNAGSISMFVVALSGFIQLIYFAYLVLTFNLTYQSIVHTAMTLTLSIISSIILYTQYK